MSTAGPAATLPSMRKGIPVSPGVAVGTAYCIHEIFVDPDTKRLEDSEVTAELARYDEAREATTADLRALRRQSAVPGGRAEAAIFGVHESILRDAAFTEKIRNWITKERLTAPAALHRLLNEYTSLFARTKDEYLRERLNDVRDVVVRLSAHLSISARPKATNTLAGPVDYGGRRAAAVAGVALGDIEVNGIVTQAGSQTSHAAIIARSRGIPAVSGVRGHSPQGQHGRHDRRRRPRRPCDHQSGRRDAGRLSQTGTRVLSSQGSTGRESRPTGRHGRRQCGWSCWPTSTAWPTREAASPMGATGVGLFRTEYLYLTHPDVPDEEEQLAAYREIIEAARITR